MATMATRVHLYAKLGAIPKKEGPIGDKPYKLLDRS